MLITLTIIGIIAALTVPNLQQKYTEHVTVNKVKKFYSTLSNAYSQAVREYGPVDTWGINNQTEENALKIYEILFKPYFKIGKNCGTSNTQKCLNFTTIKTLNGKSLNNPYADATRYYKLVLQDGIAVWFRGSQTSSSFEILPILIDTNTKNKNATAGKELFAFQVNRDNTGIIVPMGLTTQTHFDDKCTNPKSEYYDNYTCTAWVVYKGNMEYLHCDDLSWNGKQKCDK